MHIAIVMILTLFIVQGCAVHQEKALPSHLAILDSDAAGYGKSHASGAQNSHAGQWAVAIVGAPVYLALKTVVCSAGLLVAAPAAAVTALSDSPYAMGVDQLGDGVATNCGPPLRAKSELNQPALDARPNSV